MTSSALQSGTYTVDPGLCHDRLYARYLAGDGGNPEPDMIVSSEQIFISPGRQMELELVTCQRLRPADRHKLRLEVDYDVAGLFVDTKLDDDINRHILKEVIGRSMRGGGCVSCCFVMLLGTEVE